MKKTMISVLAFVLALTLLAGCNTTDGSSSAGSGADASTSTPDGTPTDGGEAGGGETSITLRFSMSNSADSVHGQTVTNWSQKLDEARAAGETGVEVVLYPNGQLGTVDEMFEQLMMGENIILATDASALKTYSDALGILDAPYFFESEDQANLVFDTDWFAEQCEILRQNGIQVVTAKIIYGSRHLMCNNEVRTPADLNGVKVRVPANDLSTAMLQAMGGVPTAMALSEVYASIQQGVINGMENPFATHVDNSMWEVCDYLNLTGHQVTISWYVMSSEVFDAMSAEDQAYLLATADDASAFFNSINKQANEEAVQLLADNGVTVVDDVDIAAFKEATASVYDQFGWSDIRAEVYAQMGIE